MATPASGAISFSNINTELGFSSTASGNLNSTTYRTLAGVPSGTIGMSNFYDKTANSYYASVTGDTEATYDNDGNIIYAYLFSFQIFIIKVSPIGTVIWQRRITTTNNVTYSGPAKRTCCDNSNNFYIAYSANTNVTFANGRRGQIAKINADGSLAWIYSYNASNSFSNMLGLAFNGTNLVGCASGTFTNGGITGSYPVFFSIDTDGNLLWTVGTNSSFDSMNVVCDTAGNSYGMLGYPGNPRFFIARLNSSGGVVWSRAPQRFAAPGVLQTGTASAHMACDSSNLYISMPTTNPVGTALIQYRGSDGAFLYGKQYSAIRRIFVDNTYVYSSAPVGLGVINKSDGSVAYARNFTSTLNLQALQPNQGGTYACTTSTGLGDTYFRMPTNGTKTGTYTISPGVTTTYSVSTLSAPSNWTEEGLGTPYTISASTTFARAANTTTTFNTPTLTPTVGQI